MSELREGWSSDMRAAVQRHCAAVVALRDATVNERSASAKVEALLCEHDLWFKKCVKSVEEQKADE